MLLGLLVVLAGWLLPPTPASEVRRAFHLSGYAQGTTYAITYYAPDSLVTSQDITTQLAEIDASMSLYQPGSLINQFNQSARGIVADQHLRVVVRKALQVYQATGGRFDATVEPLVQAWGFGTRPVAAPPSAATIRAILPHIGSDKIHLKGDSLVKDLPAMHLDLNGIAQGYSVDVLATLLERHHIQDYLVELGGEIRVRGHKWPSGELMRIGIEQPDTSAFAAAAMQQVICLPAGGVTTSGNYRKFRQWGGVRSAHLIDPKTGYAFQNELISVTVVATDALTADAYDNALMGMGLASALTFLKQNPALQAYLIYQRPDGTAAATATAGLQQLLSHP
ncbi:FAD:protein FMN transferase [Hymenobacter sp. HMF4947]|uniref:FAD:protein FMN transferase n=1 Tax=Hymenobacter ginkgonis TaxID=2682976 RepID=A0A7K1T939_9BACT|nr:FAD:protein FMN transferase [Hymenobacter ginkgonis]MVN74926.1 FAD:protein FMN transferase [Hymenobacter ginkgonis]